MDEEARDFTLQRKAVRIGGELYKRRKQRGITQTELAKISGVNRCTINGVENGYCQNPTIKTLLRIADALDAEFALVVNLTQEERK